MLPLSARYLGKRAIPSPPVYSSKYMYSILKERALSSSINRLDTREYIGIMSYNILSDTLIADECYDPQASGTRYLDWTFRVDQIFNNEIDPLDPDIICFQEKQDIEDYSLSKLIERKYLVCIFLMISSSSSADWAIRMMGC